ncbi:MAG: type II toxin-antitoxin system RelE/ParE family toxin [Acidobacteria bacterium]|nr:type II toxin-antitoxin system RelE/ParE family toxin [Acidobacteriota bacterium]
MRIFKNKWFAKFAGKEGISDKKLIQAVRDAEAGLIDADYGGGVIKQRIARTNKGKSGGYRAVILYRSGDKAFFVYGYSKKDQGNISDEEENYFKKLAKLTLAMNDKELEDLLKEGIYKEVNGND